jgi:hypothetical protein
MKECHPDKFQGDEAGLQAAEEKANKLLGYHFLVSINLKAKLNLPNILKRLTASIKDYKFVEGRLIIDFSVELFTEYIMFLKLHM